MHRRTLIAIAAGAAIAAIPAAANATIAYVTVPKNQIGKTWVTTADDNGQNPVRIAQGMSAVISPDGERLAYQVDAGAKAATPNLFILDRVGGGTVQVPGSCLGALSWSPDSKWLACQTQSADSKGYVTGNGLGLVQVPVPLTGVAGLTMTDYIPPAGNNVGYGTAFSPDSLSIAFSQQPYSSKAYAGTLYVAPLTDATQRTALLTNAMSPAWGTYGIAAVRYRNVVVRMGKQRVRTVHTQLWTTQPTGGVAQLTHYKASGLTAGPGIGVWSPTGTFLAGSIGGEDESQLATFGVPGGATRVLEKNNLSTPAAVSVDGTRVLFTTGIEGGATSIKVVGVNGKGLRTLVKQADGVSATASWNG